VPEAKIPVVMASLRIRRGLLYVAMIEKDDFWCQRPNFAGFFIGVFIGR